MTEKRVSQAGAEALFRVDPDAQISQAGSEYLHRVQPDLDAAQAGAEYLHRVQPSFSISQVGIEYLFKAVPCVTRWCQIWTIERTDGEVYRFTSLDRDFVYMGATYRACDSLVPSASEAVSEVDAAGNMDLSGALGAEGVDSWDLYAGLFDGARVEAWLVPWSGQDVRKRLLKGTFGPVEIGERGFKVELIGDGAKLQQTPLVHRLQPNCRWLFGDTGCGIDLDPLTVTGTVDSAEGLREFTDAARGETAGYFKRGRVTFTSGSNAGISAEIKEHEAGGVFTLWPRVAFPMSAGDDYEMTPGCTNLKDAVGGCKGCAEWGNLPRYGGFRGVPGADKRGAAADVRTG